MSIFIKIDIYFLFPAFFCKESAIEKMCQAGKSRKSLFRELRGQKRKICYLDNCLTISANKRSAIHV